MKSLARSIASHYCMYRISACIVSRSGRAYSTQSTSALPQGIQELKARPAKFIPDYLSPTHSHLLSTCLTDLLRNTRPVKSSPTIQSPPATLPQGHHLVYFPLLTAPSLLASDGADLDHSPGPLFPRRLWAGGEIVFNPGWNRRMILDGRAAACREEIGEVKVVSSKGEDVNKDKVFVDLWRRYGAGHIEARDGWDIEERRTLAFLPNEPASQTASRIVKYPHAPTEALTLLPTPKHLFAFSALTFNAHAIHIDPTYARNTDGHRGLLVHGPLSLSLMLRVLSEYAGQGKRGVSKLVYKNHAPLYVDEPMTVCIRPSSKELGEVWDVWIQGPEGGLAVKGTATMESD